MAVRPDAVPPVEARVPLTVLIPTLNEAVNIRHAIESVRGWARQVIVLDSLSGDETAQIVAKYPDVLLVEHPFEGYSRQWNWALDNLSFPTDWVFLMAADERPSDALKDEIALVLAEVEAAAGPNCDGFYVRRLNHFLGKALHHGGMADAHTLRIWKHRRGRFEDRSVNEHVILNGPTRRLRHFLIHDDRKGLSAWLWRHNRYSSLEAAEFFRASGRGTDRLIGYDAGFRRWVLSHVWPYVPAKPLAYFCYMYFWKLGFLDGRAGFHHARLRSQYNYWIELKKLEYRLQGRVSDPELMAARKRNG